MSDFMDTALREAFDDIAASAPVPDGLARAALGRARRQRQGRAVLAGSAAVACAAAVFAVEAITSAPAEVATAMETKTIVAFSGVRDGTASSSATVRTLGPELGKPKASTPLYSLLFDPARGSYVKLPYARVRPSPDGNRALVWTQPGAEGPAKVGVWERRTGNVRWFEGDVGQFGDTGTWSPDGKRILFMVTPAAGPPTMLLGDPGTMATVKVDLPLGAAGTGCIFMNLVWTPDSKGVAESAYCNVAGQWSANGIRIYDLTGKLTRTIPSVGSLAFRQAYSPDGGLILLAGKEDQSVTVVDAVTGAERSRLPLTSADVASTGARVLGWYDARHLAVYSVSGETSGKPQASILVVDLSGATTLTLPVPYYESSEKIFGTVRR